MTTEEEFDPHTIALDQDARAAARAAGARGQKAHDALLAAADVLASIAAATIGDTSGDDTASPGQQQSAPARPRRPARPQKAAAGVVRKTLAATTAGRSSGNVDATALRSRTTRGDRRRGPADRPDTPGHHPRLPGAPSPEGAAARAMRARFSVLYLGGTRG